MSTYESLPAQIDRRMIIEVRRLPHAAGLPLPDYATPDAAGMDLMAAIVEPVTLAQGDRALIPTGLCIALPPGHEWQLRPRSGLALHHGITIANAPATIDADYRGEVGVILLNTSAATVIIKRGERIAQAVLAPVLRGMWREVDRLSETTRAAGGFGSTGR